MVNGLYSVLILLNGVFLSQASNVVCESYFLIVLVYSDIQFLMISDIYALYKL